MNLAVFGVSAAQRGDERLCVLCAAGTVVLLSSKKNQKKTNSFSIQRQQQKKNQTAGCDESRHSYSNITVLYSFVLFFSLATKNISYHFFYIFVFRLFRGLGSRAPPQPRGMKKRQKCGGSIACCCSYSSTSCVVFNTSHRRETSEARARACVFCFSSFFIVVVHRNIVLAPFQEKEVDYVKNKEKSK